MFTGKKRKFQNAEEKTVVLCITTHGFIPLQYEYQEENGITKMNPPLFTVPNGMTIVKGTIVSTGVCNFLSKDAAAQIFRDINNVYKRTELSEKEKQEASVAWMSMLKSGTIRHFQKKLLGEGSERTNNLEMEAMSDAFMHNTRKVGIQTYKAGEKLIDKEFSRKIREKVIAEPYNFSITIVNKDGHPDLFDILKLGYSGAVTRRGEGASYGTLKFSEIVEYFQREGYEKIILYDFSCSEIFLDKDLPEPTGKSDREYDDFVEEYSRSVKSDKNVKREYVKAFQDYQRYHRDTVRNLQKMGLGVAGGGRGKTKKRIGKGKKKTRRV